MESTVSEKVLQTPTFIKETGEIGGVKVHKWTQKEYYQMAELEFFRGKRVELIEGEIIEMSPMKSLHAAAVLLVMECLRKIFTNGFVVSSQLPINFGKTSEPEPDAAVIIGEIRGFIESHPTTAELIVEVSDSTLRYDRIKKSSLYAKNKIQDYWIVNLKDKRLEVYRRPIKDKNAFYGFSYAETFIFTEKDSVSPLAAPAAKIKIADLLP